LQQQRNLSRSITPIREPETGRSDISCSVKCIPIPPQEVPAVFPTVKKHLDRAVEYAHGTLGIDDVYHDLLKGKTILWIITKDDYSIISAVITDVNQYPKKKTIRVLMAGGDRLDDWELRFCEALMEWANNIHADGIEVIGRKGWERRLEKYGYKLAHTVLLKEINHGQR
jgi:hypothetical protein